MSITDELRAWSKEHLFRSSILAIADRIDAEYQKAIRVADASVLLPVDADGEIIHVGDMMERGEARGHVIALMLSEYPKKWGGQLHWGVQLEGEQAPTALDEFFNHYHEPTVEDLLWELLGKITPFMEDDESVPIVAAYAERLRLADDGKEQ